jgi:hypothetical protein
MLNGRDRELVGMDHQETAVRRTVRKRPVGEENFAVWNRRKNRSSSGEQLNLGS